MPFGHPHREQEEVCVVVSGSGRAKLDDELIELTQWDVLRVAPPVIRAFEAGPDGRNTVSARGMCSAALLGASRLARHAG